jgi:hypothetical protein
MEMKTLSSKEVSAPKDDDAEFGVVGADYAICGVPNPRERFVFDQTQLAVPFRTGPIPKHL